MKRKGWTATELIASLMPQSEAEGILNTDLERAR
jgi:hypothetical protein